MSIEDRRLDPRGMTLLEALIAMAIVVGVGVMLAGAVKSIKSAVDAVTFLRELESARNVIRATVDCDKTIDHVGDTPKIVLYTRSDKAVLTPDADGVMAFGAWRITVESRDPTTGALDIRMASAATPTVTTALFDRIPFVCR